MKKFLFARRLITIVFLLMACFTGCIDIGQCLAAETNDGDQMIIVVVDPRIELMSIIFHLAGNSEYNKGLVKSYTKDVDEYFSSYKNHKAVKFARYLREKRLIAYNAPFSLAVYVDDAFNLKEIVALDPRPDLLDDRWNARDAAEFIKEMRSFVKDTDYKRFLKEHEMLYKHVRESMEKALSEGELNKWLNGFFNCSSKRKFIITPAMLNGDASYGASVKKPDGLMENYSITGVFTLDDKGMPKFDSGILFTVVHELCHSFINPLVDEHITELKKSGQEIFSYVNEKMGDSHYGNWQILMYESLVRACSARYIKSHSGVFSCFTNDPVELAMKCDEKSGFVWIRELKDLMGEYEANREKYKTFNSFFPRITEFFNNYAAVIDKKNDIKRKDLTTNKMKNE